MSIAQPDKPKPPFARDLHYRDAKPLLDRFHRKYERASKDECWLWQGTLNEGGYGMLMPSRNGRQYGLLAHRIAWVVSRRRSLTDNLTVDHLCFQRSCVNPAHLERVTGGENARRALIRRNGGLISEAERKKRNRERARKWRAANPERAAAIAHAPIPCPECGVIKPRGSMGWHRRTHRAA